MCVFGGAACSFRALQREVAMLARPSALTAFTCSGACMSAFAFPVAAAAAASVVASAVAAMVLVVAVSVRGRDGV